MKKRYYYLLLFCFAIYAGAFSQQSEVESFQAKKKSEQFFNAGVNSLNKGMYAEAVKSFSESLQFNPKSDKAYLQRAKANYELKETKKALEDLNQALQINNSNGEAYFCLGLYKLLIDTASADIELFNKSITNGYSQAFVYYYRAILKKYKNDNAGAITDFSVAIEKNPKYLAAYYDRGITKSATGDHQGAIADFKQVLGLDSSHYEVLNNIAQSKIKLKDYNGAITELDKLIQKKQDPVALTNRGTANLYKEDLVKAQSDFNAALGLKSNYDKAYIGLGNILFKQKKYPEAIEQYNKAIQINEKNAEAFVNRGSAKEMTGDLDGACVDWKQAASLNKQYVDYTNECN